MTIEANHLGRRFKSEWIFRNLDYQFESGTSYAITGPNGSGKSTLLKILSGLMPSSEGKITYKEEQPIEEEDAFRHMIFATPYMELVEELTLEEFLKFHFQFKKIIPGKSMEDLLEFSFLEDARMKSIKNFSSGMKQRLKLALCYFSDVGITLLDEPTSNLDKKGVQWYHDNFERYLNQRLVIICSNLDHEISFCDKTLDMQDYKGN